MKRFYAQNGIDYEKLVMECQDVSKKVPLFEKFIASTWTITGNLAKEENGTGKNKAGEGIETLVFSVYWANFESAVAARDRAVMNGSFLDYQNAIVDGIASIEGYINHRAEIFNNANPIKMLHDSAENKISFLDKIDNWVPVMTGRAKLNKGGNEWRNFLALKQIRDDIKTHSKLTNYSISFVKQAEMVNLFRTGIAGLLIELHILFKEKIPSIIIRARYSPDVEAISEHDNP